MDKLPITLAMFAKNNADSILLTIKSVEDIVSEIILVDTGSTDRTCEVAADHGARIYKVGFTDFGNIRTLTAHLAREEWVLGLDTDEILDPSELDKLPALLERDDIDAWGLPRRRWADLARTKQVEIEAYPDYQYRLLRNRIYLKYLNRVHERLEFARATLPAPGGPHIEHFQDVFKFGIRLRKRNELYQQLYELDQKEDLECHTIPAVAPLDVVNDEVDVEEC